jgi:hypothetical protein
MSNTNTQSAKSFWKEIRKFSEQTKPWETALYHDVTPDEVYDATLASRRVYGRPDEFIAIMAAAGVDLPDQPLPYKKLVLPDESKLYELKVKTGFESRDEYLEDGKPIWEE